MQTNHSVQKNKGELLLGLLVFTLIISVMNATMFNIVLPDIGKQFQISSSQASWIITGYMIVYAIGSVTYGKLTDRYSLKNLLTFGLLLFAIGSVIGLVASEYWMVIVGRIVQAAGASVIPAISMIVPVRYFTSDRRGRALGTVAIGFSRFGHWSDHCRRGKQYMELAGTICNLAFIITYFTDVSEIFR